MSKRRRRDDGGNFAIITLPYESQTWAAISAFGAMILLFMFVSKLENLVETDPHGLMTQVAMQSSDYVFYGLMAVAVNSMIAMGVHLWREYQGHQAY